MLSDQFSYVSTLDARYFDACLSKFRLLAIMNTFSQFLMKVSSYFVYLRNMAYKLLFSSTLLDRAFILCVVLQGSSVSLCLLTLCTSNIGSITLQYSCGLCGPYSCFFGCTCGWVLGYVVVFNCIGEYCESIPWNCTGSYILSL